MEKFPLSPSGRRYGALPPTLIVNPKSYKRPYFLKVGADIPSSDYNNVEKFPQPVKDQGNEGSCVGHGWSVHQEFLEAHYNSKTIELSPTGIYYLARKEEGTLGQGDCGSEVISGARVVTRFGASPLSDQPYVAGDFETPPTAAQLLAAAQNKSGAYHPIMTVGDLKSCIRSGYTFVLGMLVYDSFENIGSDGLMPMPNLSKENILGGHCMSSGWAYDDSIQCPGASKGAILTQNSWGPSFGLSGRIWIPYDYFDGSDPNNGKFVSDLWVSHLGAPWGKTVS